MPTRHLQDLPDAELLARTLAGETAAFGVLHDRHAAVALSAARRVLGHGPAAEDVVQDAFLQLWRQGDRFSEARGSLRAYLLVVVRSRALDALRHEQGRTNTSERLVRLHGMPPDAEGADVVAHTRETAQTVHRGLKALPREQGHVLGLLFLVGRTHAQVAGELDVPLGTVKGRSRLGLAKLRRELAPLAA